jgi:RNA polymerase sigma factor (TIGR02999 family)
MEESDQVPPDLAAANELLPLVYDELRRLARGRISAEQNGQTLQPTALVHEAYLRLTKSGEDPRWSSKRHFFGAAAEAMRRILIDRARNKKALKRGGGDVERMSLRESQLIAPVEDDEFAAVDEVLDRFEEVDPEGSELVKLRYFVGLTVPEVAELIGTSERTVKRQWSYARAWLRAELGRETALS